MKQIREVELSKVAEKVVSDYKILYPIELDNLLSVLNIEMLFVDTGQCDGIFLCYKGIKKILINKAIKSIGRINFTIGHELGHYFIKDHLRPIYNCNVDELLTSKSINNLIYEKEADYFASEILLPKSILKKEEHTTLLDIVKLSDKYGVSIPSAAIKIMKMQEEPMAFMYIKDDKIQWIMRSIGDIYNCLLIDRNSSIPNTSFYDSDNFEVIRNDSYYCNNNISSFGWVKNKWNEVYIKEEVIKYPNYNSGYILLNYAIVYNID